MTFCCLPSGLPHITLQNIFRRIHCISAGCGGEIVIQQSELDGRTVPPLTHTLTIQKIRQVLAVSMLFTVRQEMTENIKYREIRLRNG